MDLLLGSNVPYKMSVFSLSIRKTKIAATTGVSTLKPIGI